MGFDRVSVDEGLVLIRRHCRSGAAETIAVSAALGRVTAAAHFSRRSVPAFRAAAMDGFALSSRVVRHATRDTPVRLPITGRVAAGSWPSPLSAGNVVAIATGAPVPIGADCVMTTEDTCFSGNGSAVAIDAPIQPGRNVRQVAEDAAVGQEIVGSGHVITPDLIAAFSAYGLAEVETIRAPRAAIVVTGSELMQTGQAGVLDCNGPMIAAYLSSMNVTSYGFGPVEDAANALDRALDSACETDADIIITTGGAALGEHDLVRAAVERRLGRVVFHGLSMRPGKPVLFAVLPDGRPFFGLPGNPVSACLAMRFFVAQAIRTILGLPDERGRPVVSDEQGREDITLFLRGRYQHEDGRLSFDTKLDQRSHILSSLIVADGWLRVDRSDGVLRHVAFDKGIAL